jgi:hypothetical protein
MHSIHGLGQYLAINEATMTKAQPYNVVLVHGGFVDGCGWEGVHKILRKEGFNVSIVQHPTVSLADDVAATSVIPMAAW